MIQVTVRQKPINKLLRWLALIPMGCAVFSICELTGYLYNLIASSIGLGLLGEILAYPAHLITACIGLYISVYWSISIAPNKWLGGVIISSVLLALFTVATVLAIMGILHVNAFFYIEISALISMTIFFLIRMIPNKEELFK